MKGTIVVTGGAGFIGSAFLARLNEEGITRIIIVDELGTSDRWKNIAKHRYLDFVHKDEFLVHAERGSLSKEITAIVHMGACSSTTERDADYLMKNNYRYTRVLAEYSLCHNVRFVYASSAATYGSGERGYSDDHGSLEELRPLNMYGYSKYLFDAIALREGYLAKIAGIKFFNVYGPNEYHKEEMRSVVQKSWEQVNKDGKVRLFKSYKAEFGDGEQKRDFIYVKDCCDVILWLLRDRSVNGIFNLGTGEARSWNDLVRAVFSALGKKPSIEYIEMPEALRDQYQYFTEAKMGKLRKAGYTKQFTTLEDGVKDYVSNYLESSDRYY